jgi:hypothetical protein
METIAPRYGGIPAGKPFVGGSRSGEIDEGPGARRDTRARLRKSTRVAVRARAMSVRKTAKSVRQRRSERDPARDGREREERQGDEGDRVVALTR